MAVSGDHADGERTDTSEHENDVPNPTAAADHSGHHAPTPGAAAGPDLDAIEADLDGVDAALARLADETYWTDEVTGEPLDDALLADDPIARRN